MVDGRTAHGRVCYSSGVDTATHRVPCKGHKVVHISSCTHCEHNDFDKGGYMVGSFLGMAHGTCESREGHAGIYVYKLCGGDPGGICGKSLSKNVHISGLHHMVSCRLADFECPSRCCMARSGYVHILTS